MSRNLTTVAYTRASNPLVFATSLPQGILFRDRNLCGTWHQSPLGRARPHQRSLHSNFQSGNAGSNPVSPSGVWSRGLRRQNPEFTASRTRAPGLARHTKLLLRRRALCARLPDRWSRLRPHEGSVQPTVAGANPVAPTASGCSSIAEHGSNCFANLRGRLISPAIISHGSSIVACPVSSQRLRTNWA